MAHDLYASCIKACNECAAACDHCSTACLAEQDVGMMARCITLDMDCAQVCRLTAGVLARNSELARQVCALCAEICKECADECARHMHDHCQECAQFCRFCAEECRKIAA